MWSKCRDTNAGSERRGKEGIADAEGLHRSSIHAAYENGFLQPRCGEEYSTIGSKHKVLQEPRPSIDPYLQLTKLRLPLSSDNL